MKKILIVILITITYLSAQVSQSAINNLKCYNYLWLGQGNADNLAKATNALSNGYFNYKNKALHRNKITQLLYALDLVKKKMAYVKRNYDIRSVWEMHIKAMPSASTILQYIKQNRVNALLAQSIGQKERYKSYIDILQYYRKIPDFRKVPYGSLIKYGSRDRRIYQIKRRLTIQRFRKRFNLRGGNYIDNRLLAYINLPKDYYIKKIITNLDKIKVFLPNFGRTYVEVNVPEFKMRFYKDGYEAFSSNVVVGRLDRPTPIFDDYLEYIVVNPTWTIPEHLVKKDLIPALRKDPDLLAKAHISAYQRGRKVTPNLQKLFSYENSKKYLPYRFVQAPGGTNALGYVKFMFPNRYSVYLHDTPDKGLFSNKYRYNSSGCMRLEDPQGFFQVLLPYTNSRYADLQSAIADGKTKTIRLRGKIPVHIVYSTLEFENGAPKFLFDAYMYDKMIEESTAGHIKYGFEVPAVRLQEVRN